jgi:trans-aconitate 2-methyltransferase
MLLDMASRSWDAGTYDRVSDVQDRWADAVLERLPLRGDETVLDAGCGSGRVTRKLLDRLPCGHVVAVDASEEMVAHAREALPADRVSVGVADLAALRLDEPVDAVFSNAVFHWIADHDALFASLRGALRPGGRLVAQCGGAGNLDRFWAAAHEAGSRPPFAEHLSGVRSPTNFAGAEETAARLDAAGFEDVKVWIEPSDVTPGDPAAFIRAVNLRCLVERLPEALVDPYIGAVLERAGEPLVLDYQRLNIDATAR